MRPNRGQAIDRPRSRRLGPLTSRGIDKRNGTRPDKVPRAVYGKLLAMVAGHWTIVTGGPSQPDRGPSQAVWMAGGVRAGPGGGNPRAGGFGSGPCRAGDGDGLPYGDKGLAECEQEDSVFRQGTLTCSLWGVQVLPPSVVRSHVPPDPLARATSAFTTPSPRSRALVPLSWSSHGASQERAQRRRTARTSGGAWVGARGGIGEIRRRRGAPGMIP